MHHEDGFAESDHNLYASPYSSPYQGLVSGIRLFNWRKKKKNMNISELALWCNDFSYCIEVQMNAHRNPMYIHTF